MMKKLLLLCSGMFAMGLSVVGQNVQRTTNNDFQVRDTLRYFDYKQVYKLPVSSNTIHPTYKQKAAVITNTLITHVGSIFRNKDTALRVTGIECRALRPPITVSGIPNGVPFRLYLCKLNAQDLPIFPPVDSITAGVLNNSANQYGQYVGASFTSTNAPYKMPGDFAVLARCISTYDGDTVKIFRTAGHTATSTTAPSPAHKFGEGLGVVRKSGVWSKTTNFNDPAFGPGTDYEFCIAPMVQFTLQVSQIASVTQEGACEWVPYTNTNTSSPELTNRQFNFNEFCRHFLPFSSWYTGFMGDSVLAWDVGDGQAPVYLNPGWDTISLVYANGISNQMFTGSITGKYKQSAYSMDAGVPSLVASLTYTAFSVWCNGDTPGSGIHEMGQLASVKIYPNPTADKTIVSGLEGKNTIYLYNMTGQLISASVTNDESVYIDLLKQPSGSYLLRISNSDNNTRTVKLIKN